MAILNHGSSIRTTDGGQTTTTIVTAANIGSYAVASNATYYIGTTQNVFNRASGAQTLTGVSIDGNAATVTNGVYTTGAQTIGGAKTFSDGVVVNGATYYTFNKPTTTNYQTVALFGSTSGGLFLTTDNPIIGVGAYYNNGWIATATSGRYIDFANGAFSFNVFSGATVGGTASWGSIASLNSSGTFSATGDFRAPIFYDTNNTAYFCDPSSTSNLNVVTLNNSGSGGYLNLPGSISVSNVSGAEMVIRGLSQLRFSNSTSWDWNAWAGLRYDNATTTIYLGGPAATGIFTQNATPPTVTVSFVGTNNVTSDSNFKAPIFYDSANTAYYIDPASTSIVNAFKIYDALYFGDYTTYLSQATPYLRITTANGYGNFGPANSSWFHMTTDRPNFYMAVGLHINGDLFIYNTQSQLTSTSVRAPIFYDSGDTTYYLDPANTGTSLALAGNAGVGTASPSLSAGKGIHINSSSGHANLKLQSSGRTWELLSTTGAYFSVYDTTGGADRLTVTSGGNVGVATTSADTNLQVVGHIHVGNQTTFENTGGWNKTIYLDGAVHARMRILGSAFASGKNSATETSIWVDNSVSPYSGLDTNAGSFRISAGFTTLTNSARSPIFYDSDNTSYYIDAASTSVLNTATISTVQTNTIAKQTNGSPITINSGLNASTGLRVYYDMQLYNTLFFTTSGWAEEGRIYGSSSTVTIQAATATTTFVKYAGYSQESGSFRAPLFYDSDNTAYYIDAASTSSLNILNLAGYVDVGTYIYLRNNLRMLNSAGNGWLETIVRNSGSPYFQNSIDGGTFLASDVSENNNWLFQENVRGWGIFYFNKGTQSGQTFGNYTTIGAETFIIGQGTGTTMTSTWTGYNASSKVAIMLSNYSGYIWANDTIFSATGMRAPIFYDSDNTAYYINAAGTSVLNALTVGGNNVLTTASTLTAGNLSGTIPSAVLGNSTLYVGTTAIALNRGSASQTLTGVSIDGNAATATNSTQLGGVAAANYVRNDVDGTDSTALFRLTTITKSLTINTTWQDTGIVGANLATGCYMISVYVDNYAVSGGHYQETYTGMMSWFSTGTNSTDYDEIVLHKSGHASNGAYINLRTIRQVSGGTNLKLQIISSVSTSGASNYVFKFRRLI